MGIGNVAEYQLTINGVAGTTSVQSPAVTVINTDLSQTLQLTSSGASSFNLNELPEGFRFNAQTGLFDFLRAPRGFYTIITSANNGTGEGSPLEINLRLGAAFDVWASQQFGQSVVLDESKRPTHWGWLATPIRIILVMLLNTCYSPIPTHPPPPPVCQSVFQQTNSSSTSIAESIPTG